MINITFEKLKEISEEEVIKLIGGFSSSISNNEEVTAPSDSGVSNNCMGGNCATHCSTHQNNGCNVASGCGN